MYPKHDGIEYDLINDLFDLDRIQSYLELEETHPCRKKTNHIIPMNQKNDRTIVLVFPRVIYYRYISVVDRVETRFFVFEILNR